MMYRIEPLYYASPDYRKKEGDYFINLRFIVNITILERVAHVYILNDTRGEFIISKIQAMEILRLMENLR